MNPDDLPLAEFAFPGPLRDQFTASFKASCLKTQKASPLNQKTTDNLLMEYCACNAAYFADRVTPDQLAMSADAAAKGVRPSWFADYSGAASAYCSRDISRYMTVAS